jgi:hypothetical protein
MVPAKKESIILQDLDLALLRGLFESRVMTIAQVTALYCDSKSYAANKRLQRLKAVGFIS